MKTIAIDFDGVIHKYSKGWQDGNIYDDEVPGVFDAIEKLMEDKYSIFILSTRKPKQIKQWLLPKIMISTYDVYGMGNDPFEWVDTRFNFTCQIIPRKTQFWNEQNVLGITNRKIAAHCYIDDRGLKFDGDWKETLFHISKFKTYQHG